MAEWTDWEPFPDPRKAEYLRAPFGPGVYELRLRASGEHLLVGSGKCCACRMSSLLPAPLGQGTRNNAEKRACVLESLPNVEYRTCACLTKGQAKALEHRLRKTERYRYPT